MRKYIYGGIGIAFALLLGLVLWQRNTITRKTADQEAVTVAYNGLWKTNEANAEQMANIKAARVDNDAIAAAVAARIGSNTIRETTTRTIIEKATQDDPTIRAWADMPIPDRVRDAINAPR